MAIRMLEKLVALSVLSILISCIFATQGWALTMGIGASKVLGESFTNYLDDTSQDCYAESSNESVFAIKYLDTTDEDSDLDSSSRCIGYARGAGTAEVTVTHYSSYLDSSYETHTKEYSETFTITVKGFSKLTTSKCDDLFKGKTYSINKLYKNSLNYSSSIKDKDGKFIKGKGYKILKKGKAIKFTKTGKVAIKYKVSGKTYKIPCSKVHSQANFKKAAKRACKKACWRPKTAKIKKYKLKWSNDYGYYAHIKVSAKNLLGYRVNQWVKAAYADGDVEIYQD